MGVNLKYPNPGNEGMYSMEFEPSKGTAALEAISCLVASTWGPEIKRYRILYSSNKTL
jgi:hypothetical protein